MTDFDQPQGLRDIADRYDAILCDVWGVLHNGRHAFNEACDALYAFREQGKPVILISNAPVQDRHVASLFPKVGVRMDCYDAIATSGDVTRVEIERRAPGPVWRLGADNGWEKDNRLFDGVALDYVGPDEASFMVCMGIPDPINGHPEDSRDLLKGPAERGLEMICANPDIQVRVGDELQWCAGALARIYEEYNGPVIYPGKPHGAIYDLAFDRLSGLEAVGTVPSLDRVLAIGDGPVTDLKGAMMRGLDALYVGTGLALASEERFAEETRSLLHKHKVQTRYAMPALCW